MITPGQDERATAIIDAAHAWTHAVRRSAFSRAQPGLLMQGEARAQRAFYATVHRVLLSSTKACSCRS